MSLSTVLALIARSVATRVQRRLAQIAQVPQDLQLVLRLIIKLIFQLEVCIIDRYFYLKPSVDQVTLKLRRMHAENSVMGLVKGVAIQVWFLYRALIDYLIDLFFSIAVYDKAKIYKVPKIKDQFLYDSAVKLADKIRRKELSVEDVIQAYIHRINSTNTITTGMVDNRFKEALAEAKAIDEMLKGDYDVDELKRTKPYLGVPFTTKESVQCKGMSFTMGLLARKGIKADEDADVVKNMRQAGGILMGVSNVPELNLWCESRNRVFGQTLNPYNIQRTVGGSSGGEAAMICCGASPLGIGTDIGGSIRMPAFFCGIFGHKPTTGICSMKGTGRRNGSEKTMAVAGPMTRLSEDLIPMLKVLAGDKASILKLDDPVDLRTVHITYMEESGDIRASRVSNELKIALRKAVNHLQEVVGKPAIKLQLDGIQYSYRLWRYWMTKEPYQFDDELGNRERQVSLLEELPKKLFNMSDHTLAALFKLIDTRILPQEKASWAEPITERLRHQILEKLGENGVLIFPSHPTTARYHYSSFLRPFNFGYWAIFNVLNLPVTQVPLGLSNEGLPMGVQVIAAPHQDRLCLAVARELEREFGGWVPPFIQ